MRPPPIRPRLVPAALAVASAALLLAAADARGQSGVWTSNGPPGGTIYSVVPDPAHAQTIYAGTANGVFRSDDGAATWAPANGGLPSDIVDTIAVDPANPETLYAGTLTPTGVASDGIFKSVDRGASWSAINEGLVDPVTLSFPLDVEALAVDPSHPGVILAGTRFSEIFKSTDGGATWNAKTFGGFNVALETSAFAFDPTNSSRIFAATTQGLFISVDDGETWQGFGDAGVAFFTLAIDPTNASTLYAGDAFGTGIYKSTNGGAHWTAADTNLPAGATGTSEPIIFAIALDPAHPSTVYAATNGNGLFRSDDGAATWSPANDGLRSAFPDALAFTPPAGSGASTVYVGTLGGGVAVSIDAGAAWQPSNTGLRFSLVSGVAADPTQSGVAYAAVFDGVFRTLDGGESWQPAEQGLPIAPVAAVMRSGTRLFAGTLGGGLAESDDGGDSWSANPPGLTDADVSSFAADPTNSSVLYAGTAHPNSSPQRVFKSVDAGATWTQTGLDAGSSTIDALAVNPANSSQVVAVNRGSSSYFQSVDGGTSWSSVSPDSTCGGVNAVLFSGATIFLGGTAGVCTSVDGGKSWTLTSVATLGSIRFLLADPSNSQTLYAGAQPVVPGGSGGVYRTQDGGTTWTLLGAGLSDATITSLSLDVSGKILHAGVYGGGVAELALGPPDRLPVKPIPSIDHQTRVITRD